MFEVTQLAVGGFDDNFSYVVHETESGETFVVDPTGDPGKIRAALERYPDRIPKYILLTHGHTDHTSGLAEVRKFFPAPTIAHPVCRIFSAVQLTDGMKELLSRERMCGVDFEGRRYDTGNLKGYLEAIIDFALRNEEAGDWLREFIIQKADLLR